MRPPNPKSTGNAMQFEYRRSNLEGRWILGAALRLKAAERSFIMARIDELLRYRAETQPLGTSNCGSVFKNPTGSAAAQWSEADSAQQGTAGAPVGAATAQAVAAGDADPGRVTGPRELFLRAR